MRAPLAVPPLAVAVVAAALAITAPPAAAAVYCSPTGDYCKGVQKLDGRWRMSLSTAALYGEGTRYALCVRDPRGEETCRRFTLFKGRYGQYTSRVTWSAHFPTDGGRGRYRVRWRHSGLTYGAPLSFTR